MKKLFTSLLTGLLISCNSTYLPYKSEVGKLEQLPYKQGGQLLDRTKYNCVDKAIMYSNFLTNKGIENRCVSGTLEIIDDVGLHMWVEVYNKKTDTWHLIDPTLQVFVDGFEPKMYPEYNKVWEYPNGITRGNYDKRRIIKNEK